MTSYLPVFGKITYFVTLVSAAAETVGGKSIFISHVVLVGTICAGIHYAPLFHRKRINGYMRNTKRRDKVQRILYVVVRFSFQPHNKIGRYIVYSRRAGSLNGVYELPHRMQPSRFFKHVVVCALQSYTYTVYSCSSALVEKLRRRRFGIGLYGDFRHFFHRKSVADTVHYFLYRAGIKARRRSSSDIYGLSRLPAAEGGYFAL